MIRGVFSARSSLVRRHSVIVTRAFSANANHDTTPSNVDDTLNKLFAEQQEALNTTTDALQTIWEPVWYNLADQAVVAVQSFHDFSGLEYGWSIVGVTILMRLGLFPVMIRAQQTTSRMAHLQPELTQIKNRYEALGAPSRQDQLQFSKTMKALFDKYQVKPMRAFLAPALQLPLFMGMFFGLKKMPSLYPDELSTGGMFWFPDLTASDPLYILPLASSGTFLLLIEMGKDQMMAQDPAKGQLMLNVFRIMSLAMLPVCFNLDSAMLCYWTVNNVVTMGQTAILKAPMVRKQLGIWDPPKPVPGRTPETLTEAVEKLAKRVRGDPLNEKQRMEEHNQAVEAKKKTSQVFRQTSRKNYGITGVKNRP
jgi:YidC/Oxa1 family membrane protein insertase